MQVIFWEMELEPEITLTAPALRSNGNKVQLQRQGLQAVALAQVKLAKLKSIMSSGSTSKTTHNLCDLEPSVCG